MSKITPEQEQALLEAQRLTWEEIVAIDPRIGELYEQAKEVAKSLKGRGAYRKRYNAWYQHTSGKSKFSPEVLAEREGTASRVEDVNGDYGFKDKVCNLVGHSSYGDKRLCTMHVYDVVYDKVSDALGTF